MLTNDIKFAMETLSNVEGEIKPLLEKHWEEIALNKEKIKLNPNWEAYHALEKNGQLGIFTVRKEGKLIGYFVVIAETHIHYKDHVFASNDVIYLAPEYRKGMIGASLIKYAEENLKKLGASVIAINTKDHKPFDRLLEHLDYKLSERVYLKYVGD